MRKGVKEKFSYQGILDPRYIVEGLWMEAIQLLRDKYEKRHPLPTQYCAVVQQAYFRAARALGASHSGPLI